MAREHVSGYSFGMKGLRKHTHADRQRVIDEMIPLIREELGDNLIALASLPSFSIGRDLPYSDLEFIAFVRDVPGGKDWNGMGKIRDGLLVEMYWVTEAGFKRSLDGLESDWIVDQKGMEPLLNAPFIEALKKYEVPDAERRYLRKAKDRWNEVQESAGKVLNEIGQGADGTLVRLLATDMLLHMLAVLASLNCTCYSAFSTFLHQAAGFKWKAKGFDALVAIVLGEGKLDLPKLQETTEVVFGAFEEELRKRGVQLYRDDLKPEPQH